MMAQPGPARAVRAGLRRVSVGVGGGQAGVHLSEGGALRVAVGLVGHALDDHRQGIAHHAIPGDGRDPDNGVLAQI